MVSKNLIIRWFHRRTPAQLLLLFYSLAIVLATGLLSLPINYKEGVQLAFIDILFTAVSALSVTGLTTISIADTMTTFGTIVLTFILQLGAIGIMGVSTLVWIILGRKIGISERRLMMQDLNQLSFGDMVKFIKQIIYVVLWIELVGFIILGTYFLRYFPTMSEAYYHGFFSAISAMTNAGFSLTNNSMIPYAEDYFVQTIVMILIILGAIGFPVLIEVTHFIRTRRRKKAFFRFSLFTKVTTVTFFSLIAVGAITIFLIDINGYFKDTLWHESLFYALFQSVTTRSAGLTTLDVNMFSEGNHLFLAFLMFIGASPSSAGGGIRTTTFALVVIFLITYARGGKKITLFQREIYDEDLIKAVTIMILAFIFVFLSLLIMTIIEPYPLSTILFEITSAFGTVGLSLGITNELTTFSKIILMILMFIGRVGLITFLFSFRTINENNALRYPKERIIIG